jgi:uncharacterized protein YpiB (UPF0302 family)
MNIATISPHILLFALVFMALVVVGLIVLLGLMIYRQRATLTPEKAKEVIIRAEERAQIIVDEAIAESRSMRDSIERERIKAIHEDKQSIERFLDAYRFQLEKSIKELSYGVEKEHMRATSRFVEALQNIEQRVALNAEEAKHSMESFTGQSSELFSRLSIEIENVEKGIQHLALALEEAAANESDINAQIVREEMRRIGQETARSIVKVAEGLDDALRVNIEQEFATLSHELGKYREARMRLVNERILVLIEETAQIALQKKLSLQDQADLVYRSLEEAKRRGVFV